MGSALCGFTWPTAAAASREPELESSVRNVVILGGAKVGKTTFAQSFDGPSSKDPPLYSLELGSVRLNIWDTDKPDYIKRADALVFVFSNADRASWTALEVAFPKALAVSSSSKLQSVLIVGTHQRTSHSFTPNLTELPLPANLPLRYGEIELPDRPQAESLLRLLFP